MAKIAARGNEKLPNLTQTTFAKKLYLSMMNTPDPVTGKSLTQLANERLKALYENDLYKYSTTFMEKIKVGLLDPSMNIGVKSRKDGKVYFRQTKAGGHDTVASLKARYDMMLFLTSSDYLKPEHIQARLTVDSRRFGLSESDYKFMIEFFADADLKVKEYESDTLLTNVAMYVQNSNLKRLPETFKALRELYEKRLETARKLKNKNYEKVYASPQDFFIDQISKARPDRIDAITSKYIDKKNLEALQKGD